MARPPDFAATLRLRWSGMTWRQAETIVALSHGLRPVRSGWSLDELGDLELLRFEALTGRIGGRLDGTSTPTAPPTGSAGGKAAGSVPRL